METLFILVLLACPVGMGAMMWMMMRNPSNGQAQQSPASAQEQELARLRAEIRDLRDEAGRTSTPDGR